MAASAAADPPPTVAAETKLPDAEKKPAVPPATTPPPSTEPAGTTPPDLVARIPGGEWAEPEDLAGTAVFLASPAARLINGVTIPVDGGYTAS